MGREYPDSARNELTRSSDLVNTECMKITENIYEAKTHFSQLIERAMAGDEVIIAKAGHPVVCLVPYRVPHPAKRTPGSASGAFQMSEDFDAPMSEAELKDWGA